MNISDVMMNISDVTMNISTTVDLARVELLAQTEDVIRAKLIEMGWTPPGAVAWRPIETAPRDGTDVLVLLDVASVRIAHIAWWVDLDTAKNVRGDAEDVGWWCYPCNSVTQTKLDGYHAPLAWMPLPSTRKFVL